MIFIIKLPGHDSSLFAVPPVIKDKEKVTNVSVLVNQLTNLFCEVEGIPSPIIMWYKDDVQVRGDSRYVSFLASEVNRSDVTFFLKIIQELYLDFWLCILIRIGNNTEHFGP